MLTTPLSRRAWLAGAALAAGAGRVAAQPPPATILNVSYDPTRELYKAYNAAFVAYWLKKTGQALTITQSHGGSARQAQAVIDGLEADVVTLGLSADIDAVCERARLLPSDWQRRLPFNASPYTSTVVFLVRAGNPKKIKDWPDVFRPGAQVITSNPKTSSGGRWNYMAAVAYASRSGGAKGARDAIAALYRNVPVLDSGARGSTITFTERGVGDVLVAWENEARLVLSGPDRGRFEMVLPSLSILAEPPVALVDVNAKKKGVTSIAGAYLQGLYAPFGQAIIAANHYRPRDPKALAAATSPFPKIAMAQIGDFGGWRKVEAEHFAPGGVYDKAVQGR